MGPTGAASRASRAASTSSSGHAGGGGRVHRGELRPCCAETRRCRRSSPREGAFTAPLRRGTGSCGRANHASPPRRDRRARARRAAMRCVRSRGGFPSHGIGHEVRTTSSSSRAPTAISPAGADGVSATTPGADRSLDVPPPRTRERPRTSPNFDTSWRARGTDGTARDRDREARSRFLRSPPPSRRSGVETSATRWGVARMATMAAAAVSRWSWWRKRSRASSVVDRPQPDAGEGCWTRSRRDGSRRWTASSVCS